MLNTPILFLIFNRPDTTQIVFNTIRKVQPARLYIAADGPRDHYPGEDELCQQTKQITDNIDWPCSVKRLYRTKNLGCGRSVSSAITWFFEHEEEGIILEDDCNPSDSFYWFCEVLLDRYRDDLRVWHISGNNLISEDPIFGDQSYAFSLIYGGSIWGWATWKNRWCFYDYSLNSFSKDEFRTKLFGLASIEQINARIENFLAIKRGYDTWDYQWAYCRIINSGLSIVPKLNMIQNIGFDSRATHTTGRQQHSFTQPSEMRDQLTHPRYIIRNTTLESKVYTQFVRQDKPSLARILLNRIKSLFL